ncbi:hypothetical protein ACSSS7_004739 [Eimeria intestinalis]
MFRIAFERGDCEEEARVFRLTGISNSETTESFVPCFLSSYFSPRHETQQQQQQQQQQQRQQQQRQQQEEEDEEEEVDAEEILRASGVSRLDWSEAYRDVSSNEIKGRNTP